MAKLVYGNGNCSVIGSQIIGVQIKYKGAASIIDKTSSSFVYMTGNNQVLIFPNPQNYIEGSYLGDLLEYTGDFTILSVIVVNKDIQRLPCSIKMAMDYSELLGVSEDLTINSENMGSVNRYKNSDKRFVPKQVVNNLHTSKHNGVLFLSSGEEYLGDFHIHLETGVAMTGKEHTEESQNLYLKVKNRLKSTNLKRRKATGH